MFMLVAFTTIMVAMFFMPNPRYETIKIPKIILSIALICVSIVCIFSPIKLFADIIARENIVISQEIEAIYKPIPFHFDDSAQEIEKSHNEKYYASITSDNWFIFYSEEEQTDIPVISPHVISYDSISFSDTFEAAPSITELFITYELNMTKFEKFWFGIVLPQKTWTATIYEVSIPANLIIENCDVR